MPKIKNTEEVQREALIEFRKRVVSWCGEENLGPVLIDNISDMERIIKDLSSIGRYVIVDFTDTYGFDRFSMCYRKNEHLYVAWYERSDRLGTGEIHSQYLKFKPTKMLINAAENPRLNHIVIDTAEICPAPKSKYTENPDEYGIQEIIDPEGRELRRFEGGEICHVFNVVCNPGRVVMHPKGSLFASELRGYYFREEVTIY